jgi:uncharacterized protein (TIGR02594 family)
VPAAGKTRVATTGRIELNTDETGGVSPANAKVAAVLLEALKWRGASARDLGVPLELWCADFMNFVLRRTGHSSTNSRAARSFLKYGKVLDGPRVGAIAVLKRGRSNVLGHVGVVRGTDGSGNPIVVSGNHGNKVAQSVYPKSKVLLYVMP